MIMDRQNTFSNDQAITATAISTNVIDLGPLGGLPSANLIRDIGAGEPLYLHILVTTALDSAGEAATTTVTLESDSTANLATSATVHWTSGSIAESVVGVAGYWIAKGVPLPSGAYERYLGVRYTIGTENMTSGNVTAWISNNRYDDRTYRGGFSTGVS
jgi:hypothetical protein